MDPFEGPPPIARADVDMVSAEASGGLEGRFRLFNAGGGVLAGRVASNSRAVTLTPAEFAGNEVEVGYSFVPDFYAPGEVARAEAVVVSNGGELVVPFVIRLTPPALLTRDGAKLSSLQEFADFAAGSPVEARQLFTRWEFADWLARLGYEQMALYERFIADPNKERGLDSFLIVSGLKTRPTLAITRDRLRVYLPESGTEPATGAIGFTRGGAGYAAIALTVTRGADWLRLDRDKLTSADFDADGNAEALFLALPNGLPHAARGLVLAETDTEALGTITIDARRRPAVAIQTDRAAYAFEDDGEIRVTNRAGMPIELDITARDAFVRLPYNRVRVGESAAIPFQTRTPLLTRLGLRGQGYLETAIEVRGAGTQKTLMIKIGSIV